MTLTMGPGIAPLPQARSSHDPSERAAPHPEMVSADSETLGEETIRAGHGVWAAEYVIGGSFNILTPPGTVKSTMHNSVSGTVIVVGFSFGVFKANKFA